MGMVPQPIEVAMLKGAHKKNPQRYTTTPVRNDKPLGPPPDHLSPEAKAVWFELDEYALPKVLTITQRLLLEPLANMFAEYRKDPSVCTAAMYGTMLQYLIRTGYSVECRQKLGTEKPQVEDKFANFQ